MSGNIFGVAAFLSQPVGYVGTTKAVQNSEVYVWEHSVIRQLAKEYPLLAKTLSEPCCATLLCSRKGILRL